MRTGGGVKKKATPAYYSRAVAKACDVIELLSRASEPATLALLAPKLRLTKTSLLRILGTLEDKGFIRKDENGCYLLAQETKQPTTSAFLERLSRTASEPLRQLNRQFRETISLSVLYTNHIEVVMALESPETIRMTNTPGRILPPHASAMGKSIAAYQPDSARASLIESYGLHVFTPHTIHDVRQLEMEYEGIRKRGFSVDREETVLQGWCYGAPIFDSGKRAVAAISLSMPKSRLKQRGGETSVVRGVTETARKITKALGVD